MIPKYNDNYYQQLRLLITVLPEIANEECFCIKGGTAINLFYTDMPRISVDIDLVYLPLNDRTSAIQAIETALLRIKTNIENLYQDIVVYLSYTQKEKRLNKLYITSKKASIVVEPNFILRGSLYPTEKKTLTSKTVDLLNISVADIPILSRAETYAGKICAALNRQHPRDLFDIKILYENGGITEEIRQAFVVYLAGASRPMHELLNPNFLDIETVFLQEFIGMTTIIVNLDELIEIRKMLVTDIKNQLTDNEKAFLISIKTGNPKWELMPFDHLSTLPGLRWKLINIQRMKEDKRQLMHRKLSDVLSV